MKSAASTISLLKYRFLMSELVSREIKNKYKKSALGIVWSVLNPLLMMLVLNVVFSHLFRFDIPNYLVYYLTGSLIFSFMQEATSGALYSIFGNAGLINKVYIPKYVFPIAKTTSAFVNFLFSLIALTIVAFITGVRPNLALILIIPLFIMTYLFILGLSFIFATYTVFFRDIIHIHGILMMMWVYMTPIFYPEKILYDKAPFLLVYNPIYHYVKYFRLIVINGVIPDLSLLASCLLLSLGSLLIGLLVFIKNQNKFVQYF